MTQHESTEHDASDSVTSDALNNAYFQDHADAYKYTRSSAANVWFAHTAEDGQVHRWITRVRNVVATGQGCAVCHGKKV